MSKFKVELKVGDILVNTTYPKCTYEVMKIKGDEMLVKYLWLDGRNTAEKFIPIRGVYPKLWRPLTKLEKALK